MWTMNQEQIREIERESGLDVYALGKDRVKYLAARQNFVDSITSQIVGECVLAILATDTRQLVYTTYDRDMVGGIISKVVDSVRDHFKEANA